MRFFLSILAVVIAVIVVIVIVATNGSGPKQKEFNVTSYNYPGTSVVQTTTGILTGQDMRQAIRISVSQSNRTIDILTGYNQNVTSTESFSNDSAAYDAFLGALQNASYTHSRFTTQQYIYGICPLGNTYQYVLNSPSGPVSNLWSTGCSTKDGTFAGNGPLIRQLFTLQIPNYNAFTQNVPNIVSASSLFTL